MSGSINAHQLIGYLKQKYFYYGNHENPVKVLDCNSYKTGKHGHGKTTLKMIDLFTEKILTDIVSSDEPFYEMEKSQNYDPKNDAEVVNIEYKDDGKLNIELIWFNDQLKIENFKNINAHYSFVKDVEDYLDRKNILKTKIIVPEDLGISIYTNLVSWSTKKEIKQTCMHATIEKI